MHHCFFASWLHKAHHPHHAPCIFPYSALWCYPAGTLLAARLAERCVHRTPAGRGIKHSQRGLHGIKGHTGIVWRQACEGGGRVQQLKAGHQKNTRAFF